MRLKEIKPDMVIHCKTEEEKEILIRELDRLGYVWCTGDRVVHLDIGQKVDTVCYSVSSDKRVTWSFCSEQSDKTITEFSDLIIPELSAKEVLEALHDMCLFYNSEGRHCDDCPADPYCISMSFKNGMDSFLDACTKWREEHPKEEKKELETEWVYVVRIIKVHENGKKECVFEVEAGESMDGIENVIKRELKDYVANNKGNFFATLEHICRIKE